MDMGRYDHYEKPERKRAQKKEREQRFAAPVDVTTLNPSVLQGLIYTVCQQGGAIRIGLTRDGGAWAFGIYADGMDPTTEYVRPTEDVNDYLESLSAWFGEQSHPDTPGSPVKPR